MLVLLPPGTERAELVSALTSKISSVPTVGSDAEPQIVLCREVGEVALASVARRLVESHPDCVAAIRNLHTRIDVNWSELEA